MKNKAILAALAVVIVIGATLTLVYGMSTRNTTVISPSSVPESRAASSPAAQVVKNMKAGWNLGGTMESIDSQKQGIFTDLGDLTPEEFYETYWGNPVTTYDMIKAVADMGFGAVRVPVTYSDHMDEDFQIRSGWLTRVEQVVDFVTESGMYCIINLHHDTGSGSWPWLKADPDNLEVSKERLHTVWAQIAEHFQDYDNQLIFEGFNEILDTGDNWTNPNPGAYDVVNALNQEFVNTIRSAPGHNSNRFLILNTYGAGSEAETLNAFVLPEDTLDDHLIVSVHSYIPLEFSWPQSDINWTQAYSDWNSERDGKPVDDMLERLKTTFTDKGIPVIVGEMGAWNKNNTEDRIAYATNYFQTARAFGISCFWWDDGGNFSSAEDVGTSTLFDRYANEWFFPDLANAIIIAGE